MIGLCLLKMRPGEGGEGGDPVYRWVLSSSYTKGVISLERKCHSDYEPDSPLLIGQNENRCD